VPTRRALNNLLNEHVPRERIVVVGNTVVDAALEMAKRCDPIPDRRLSDTVRAVSEGDARVMLVTAHRRESWGPPLDRILAAVGQIVTAHPDLHCVLPMHPNPLVRAQVCDELQPHPRVVLTDPLPYPVLCRLLARAALVLTDSGGIQEEAPSFRVPTLVLRDVTERMEAVHAGWARLVGTDTGKIVLEAERVLRDASARPSTSNPFGDGHAAARSAQVIAHMLGQADLPEEFQQTGRVPVRLTPHASHMPTPALSGAVKVR
jgi:UDP-N-acetylglucosamine 2-epimerase (non-hydrolysing)